MAGVGGLGSNAVEEVTILDVWAPARRDGDIVRSFGPGLTDLQVEVLRLLGVPSEVYHPSA